MLKRRQGLRSLAVLAILILLMPLVAACGGSTGTGNTGGGTTTNTPATGSGTGAGTANNTPATGGTSGQPTETTGGPSAKPTAQATGGAAGQGGPATDPAILAAAKKEGKVVWYASMSEKNLKAVADEFQKKFPDIKIETLRLSADKIPPRIATEKKAGQIKADVVSGTGFEFQQVKELGALEKYNSPEFKFLAKGTVDPEGYWGNLYLNTNVVAWNPEVVKKQGLPVPKSWEDFTKPEWKGKFAIDPGSYDIFAGWLFALGEEKGKDLARRLAANQPLLREGHTLNVEQVEAGEFAGTISAYGYKTAKDEKKGLPIASAKPDPFLVSLTPVGITKGSANPNAAKVLMDWLLSREGQQFIVDDSGRSSSRTDVENKKSVLDLQKDKPFYIDPAKAKDINAIVEDFNKIFGIQ